MRTLARSVYLDSQYGVDQDLPRAGSALENRFVFDDVARELKAMATQGLVEIVGERTVHAGADELIEALRFKRLR